MSEYSGRHTVKKRDPITSCSVYKCKNKVLTSPEKHFFRIPERNKAEWCVAVGKTKITKGPLYICEDHINVEEDLMNYDEWKSKNVYGKLKTEVPNLRNISLAHAGVEQASTSSFTLQTEARKNKGTMFQPEIQHKSVQVKASTADRCIGTNKPLIKVKQPVSLNKKRNIAEFIAEDFSEEHTPSAVGSTTEFSETESSVILFTPKSELVGRQFMLNLIMKKPQTYLGLSKQSYWLIEYLEKKCHICSLYIKIVLFKIKSNDTFEKISDYFEISKVTLWRIYYKVLQVLRSFFNQFVFWPKEIDIKRNLPLVFRTNSVYSNVQSIIDCFEIEIEKPKKPVEQSLTWSQYKNCNTVKYLISATPDGFINFVSEGYGGRISDINLVQQSGFLEVVPANSIILADRGFKHLESHLGGKNVKILRPPSLSKECKMTKTEAIESKVIASLRVHIERVIRRVRLYKILKPHSVVNNKLVNSLDDVVIVACGLINLQSPVLHNC